MKEQFTKAAKLVEDLPGPDYTDNLDRKQIRDVKRRVNELYKASDDDVARYKIVLGIIERGFSPSLLLLRRALFNDPSALIRHEAAFGIAKFQGTKAEAILIKALQDSHPIVRHEAADMLGDVGTRKAIKPLKTLLDEPNTGFAVAETARMAIQFIELRQRSSVAV